MVLKHVIVYLGMSLFVWGCSGESHPEKVNVKVEPENQINRKFTEKEVQLIEDPLPIESATPPPPCRASWRSDRGNLYDAD